MKHALPTTLRKKTAQSLKALREGAQITQEQLALAMGVHKSFVSQVERAIVNISIDTYAAYSDALAPTIMESDSIPLRVRVGQRVRFARESRKITQEELAEMTGFSVVYVGQVELGHTNTSLDRLEALSLALALDPNYLLTQDDYGKE